MGRIRLLLVLLGLLLLSCTPSEKMPDRVRIASTRQALTTLLDIPPAPDGVGDGDDLDRTNATTLGETFVLPAVPAPTDVYLRSFTVYLGNATGSTSQFRAYVYAWDAVHNAAIAPALYRSAPQALPGGDPAVPHPVTFDVPGNLALVPGSPYVVFISVAEDGDTSGAGRTWGGTRTATSNPNGRLWFVLGQGSDTSQWTATNPAPPLSDWVDGSGLGLDLALQINLTKAESALSLVANIDTSVFGDDADVTLTATFNNAVSPTGLVSLTLDGNAAGTASITGNTATFNGPFGSTMSVGGHSFQVSYAGDANNEPVSSAALPHTVTTISTTVALADSNPAPTFGDVGTITATVSPVAPGAGVPTGSVAFSATNTVTTATTPLGTFPVGLSGVAQVSPPPTLAPGSYTVAASFTASGSYANSIATPLPVTVAKAPTSTAVSSTSNTSLAGVPVTYTAIVSATTGTLNPLNVGSVDFFDGASMLGSVTVTGGSAVITPPAPSVGSHPITAVYNGDANIGGSTSGIWNQSVSLDASLVAVTSSVPTSHYGDSVTFTVHVTSTASGLVPDGTVSFFDGSDPLNGGAPIGLDAAGSAQLSTAALLGGNHNISVTYDGGTKNQSGSGGLAGGQLVLPGTTTTTVSPVTASVFGQSVTFTATVAGPGTALATGMVTFLDGATTLGSVQLDAASQATFPISTLSVGSHPIVASYVGDSNFAGSSSTPATQVVGQASTTTALATSSNPITDLTSVTFTATVSANAPGSGTPGGTITFTDNGVTIGTGTLNPSGIATLTIATLTAGSHPIVATYAGSTSFSGSGSTTVTETVSPDASVTQLVSSANPAAFGAAVTFTATVIPAHGGTPTGTMTFKEGTNVLATKPLAGGSAATPLTLPVGTHTIVAEYGGDGANLASTGQVVQVVNPATATAAVSSSANPATFGQSVTLTATVTSGGASVLPTGGVTFMDGATTLASRLIDGTGKATLPINTLAVGTHSITVVYAGDLTFASATSPALSQVVNTSATTTTVASSSNPSLLGKDVTFTATVAATSPGSGTPTGTVTFSDGASSIGTATLGTGGVATFTASGLSAGSHSITAAYSGSPSFAASTSVALRQAVNTEAATIAVSANPSPSVFGASITLTATVTGNAGAPTGTVNFKDGQTSLGSPATIDGTGHATFTTSVLNAGTHSITAAYSGDGIYASGTGSVALVVAQAPSSVALTSSANPSVAGATVTFTAAVTAAAGFTGKVEFTDGATALGSANLSDGSAALTTSSLSQGTHAIKATYDGDPNFASSTSAALSQVVNAPASPTDGGTPPAPTTTGPTKGPDAGAAATGSLGGGSDDCSCRVVASPSRTSPSLALVGIALAALLARRRRRHGAWVQED